MITSISILVFDRGPPSGETMTMTSPSLNSAPNSKRLSSQKTYPRSILKNKKAEESVWNSSPLAMKVLQGSIASQKANGASTPNSLYDADGFLR
ncbi:hypothetical protein MRB53_038754 [Persea americana]|nr:hypothetical protein MRB53_038754 [Persea americana]